MAKSPSNRTLLQRIISLFWRDEETGHVQSRYDANTTLKQYRDKDGRTYLARGPFDKYREYDKPHEGEE